MVYDVTMPRSHITSRIMKIVQSIEDLLGVAHATSPQQEIASSGPTSAARAQRAV
jgi:hypothetical protein